MSGGVDEQARDAHGRGRSRRRTRSFALLGFAGALAGCSESVGGQVGDTCRTEHGCIEGLRCDMPSDETVGTCVMDSSPPGPATTSLGSPASSTTLPATSSSGGTTTAACLCEHAVDCGGGDWMCRDCMCIPGDAGDVTSGTDSTGDAKDETSGGTEVPGSDGATERGSSSTGLDCGGCTLPNATSECSEAGICEIVACHEGYGDCDEDASNGCETNTEDDWQHCSQCNERCDPGYRCDESTCTEGLDLLLIAGNDTELEHVRTMMVSSGRFNIIDAYNASVSANPILQNLLRYDAILVWSTNQSGMGPLLADYFRAGGTVVAPFPIYGAIENEFGQLYTFIHNGSASPCSSCSLGTIEDPDSPLLEDVASFSADRMPIVPGELRNNGEVVAYWSNGVPMIVVGEALGRRRVDLNLSPFSTAFTSSGWDESTDGARLLENALLFR